MRQEHLVAFLVAGFLMGCGLFLSYFGWNHLHTIQRLEQNPAVIEGRVVSKARRALSGGGQSSTLVVEYLPAAHPGVTKEFDVDGSAYRAAVATGKAMVTYLPEDPEISLITKFAVLPYQILLGLGLFMMLAGLFCIRHMVKVGVKVGMKEPGTGLQR